MQQTLLTDSAQHRNPRFKPNTLLLVSRTYRKLHFMRYCNVATTTFTSGVGKMRNCGMRNAESKMRNGPCGKVPRNGV